MRCQDCGEQVVLHKEQDWEERAVIDDGAWGRSVQLRIETFASCDCTTRCIARRGYKVPDVPEEWALDD